MHLASRHPASEGQKLQKWEGILPNSERGQEGALPGGEQIQKVSRFFILNAGGDVRLLWEITGRSLSRFSTI
jgi:hypothetical protein